MDEFERALGCSDEDGIHAWAQLYKAHCLHDMGQYEEALTSYALVDLSQFTGPPSWRVDVIREQQAYYTFMVGQKEKAHNMLSHILDRYEKEPKIASNAMSFSLQMLAQSLSSEMYDRLMEIDQKSYEAIIS